MNTPTSSSMIVDLTSPSPLPLHDHTTMILSPSPVSSVQRTILLASPSPLQPTTPMISTPATSFLPPLSLFPAFISPLPVSIPVWDLTTPDAKRTTVNDDDSDDDEAMQTVRRKLSQLEKVTINYHHEQETLNISSEEEKQMESSEEEDLVAMNISENEEENVEPSNVVEVNTSMDLSSMSILGMQRILEQYGIKISKTRKAMEKQIVSLCTHLQNDQSSKEDAVTRTLDGPIHTVRYNEMNEEFIQAVGKAIKENSVLYEDILRFHMIDLESVLKYLAKSGVKCSKKVLIQYLDTQGIAFQSSGNK